MLALESITLQEQGKCSVKGPCATHLDRGQTRHSRTVEPKVSLEAWGPLSGVWWEKGEENGRGREEEREGQHPERESLTD